jgi:GrpB-like predicted nucleotidyltransferase (UPF0157 family)
VNERDAWRDPRLPADMEVLGTVRGDAVRIVPYDHSWPRRFTEWQDQLALVLGPVAIRIDHVGSTAVPGLEAKPVVDIQVSVQDVDDEPAYRPGIESLGPKLRSRERGHRYFRPPPGMDRVVQIHVCAAGSEWERAHLLFPAYLRAHPEHANAYADLKRQLASRFPNDRIGYADAKGPFIDEILRNAENWASATDWRP